MAAPVAGRSLRGNQGLRPRIALTSGEPGGIGPELCLAIARESRNFRLICLGDRELLAQRARQVGWNVVLRDYDRAASGTGDAAVLEVLHEPLAVTCDAGRLDHRNARYVLNLLDRAIRGCRDGEFDAMVTAPLHKGIINDAGVPFTGHTEYLAQRLNVALPVMLLAAPGMRVALATTHLPLKEVSAALSVETLCQSAAILDADLKRWWGLERPRIAVCGLNPHAGEGGYLGDEELRVIGPAIARMRAAGIEAAGPLPADTVFVPAILSQYAAVLAMYHDQGLPVVKHAGFDKTVNITLGLPILRTSVDHGTALDLAGTGRADPGSLAAAIALASELAARRGG